MGKFLLVHPALSDASLDAYFCSSETAQAPVSNLLLRQPKEVWETTGVASTIEVRFDLQASPSYDFIGLLFTNATPSATVTWDGSTVTTFASTVWTSGSISLRATGQANYDRVHGYYLTSGTQTAQYVRFRVSDTTNPDGVFRAGRFICGKAYRPTVNVEYPLGFGFNDEAPTTTTSAGERITRANEPVPYLTFTMQAWGPTAQAEFYSNIHEVMRTRGAAKDVLAIIDPEHASLAGPMTYYGTLQQRTQIQLSHWEFYEASFELQGLI